MSGYGRTVSFTPPCVSFQPMKNGRRKADLFHLAQRYTQAQTDAVQPPDDRTYSAEVTSFLSNLLHHRSACFLFPGKIRKLPLHTLEYLTTSFFICQELFYRKSRFFIEIFVEVAKMFLPYSDSLCLWHDLRPIEQFTWVPL